MYDYGNPDLFIKKMILEEQLIIAISGGKIVGFLLYQVLWGNTVLLALVKIRTDFQKKGIGTKLVNSFEKHLKIKKYDSYLSSTEIVNLGSQEFHNSLGLQSIGNLNMPDGVEKFYIKNIGI